MMKLGNVNIENNILVTIIIYIYNLGPISLPTNYTTRFPPINISTLYYIRIIRKSELSCKNNNNIKRFNENIICS